MNLDQPDFDQVAKEPGKIEPLPLESEAHTKIEWELMEARKINELVDAVNELNISRDALFRIVKRITDKPSPPASSECLCNGTTKCGYHQEEQRHKIEELVQEYVGMAWTMLMTRGDLEERLRAFAKELLELEQE